nr:hypothetical protein GCM10020092_093460 [Actinoplanes digitatis]
MTKSDAGDATGRLADEIARFAGLGARAKGMLNAGDLGAEFSALMLLFPMQHLGPMRVTDLAEVKGADPSTVEPAGGAAGQGRPRPPRGRPGRRPGVAARRHRGGPLGLPPAARGAARAAQRGAEWLARPSA